MAGNGDVYINFSDAESVLVNRNATFEELEFRAREHAAAHFFEPKGSLHTIGWHTILDGIISHLMGRLCLGGRGVRILVLGACFFLSLHSVTASTCDAHTPACCPRGFSRASLRCRACWFR
jgi:hypothetical protein